LPEPYQSVQIEPVEPDLWLANPDFYSKVTDLNDLIDKSSENQVLDSSPILDSSRDQLNQSDQTSK
jgi:hypothetical protein